MLRQGIVASVAAAAVLLGLAGCGRHEPGDKDPAVAASRLMAAALKGDRVAFEAEIDRRAVREDLRRQIFAVSARNDLQIDGGPSDFALDRMISPAALNMVTAETHQALIAAPTPDQLAPLIKPLGRKRACLKDLADDGRCLLTFAKAKDRWRLVGMAAMTPDIPVATGD